MLSVGPDDVKYHGSINNKLKSFSPFQGKQNYAGHCSMRLKNIVSYLFNMSLTVVFIFLCSFIQICKVFFALDCCCSDSVRYLRFHKHTDILILFYCLSYFYYFLLWINFQGLSIFRTYILKLQNHAYYLRLVHSLLPAYVLYDFAVFTCFIYY